MNMDSMAFRVNAGAPLSLRKLDPGFTGPFKAKDDAQEKLARDIERLGELQSKLYAQNTWAVLVILQAMDAAGKDGVVKHVMSGVNPQGVSVVSFKAPTEAELNHDFLWRHLCVLPRRGEIGIFNRSYYEEVLIVRVHKEIFDRERLPQECKGKSLWDHRYEDINATERYLARNGIAILKFFLHVSKKEQKRRFLERIDQKEKNWKFSPADLKERLRWTEYMRAYEEMLHRTSTEWAPWHIIPADHKWFTRTAVADIIVKRMQKLNISYPSSSREHLKELDLARQQLESE